ncbi:MAG TPA: methyltransferase domain-containing protein [Methanocella sp.]|uniref:class I SAM-dependent methyltransferase n=1 Tax=Methanocella sp. TaxID=2052833 RepID=UPI002C916F68|nr:methyltransferase domain-containing protein [Methanocella sp.]HTY90827.1 methyltransferase domain-containing protein [Methanocella sp.]
MADEKHTFVVESSKREHAEAYDEASDIYDTYEGLFFPYLFGRIRSLLIERFIPRLPPGARVLDIGCGTGQQTLLFDKSGFDVVGIDISPGLVKVANKKLGKGICLVSDACKLPFPDACFDAVSSAGSTLNHIPDYQCFFDEAGRVLKPGGYLFLESDNKWKLDIFWSFASTLTGDPLKYHETLPEVIGYVRRPFHEGYPYVFPLTFDENKFRLLRLRAFTFHELQSELENIGCEVLTVHGAHSITNIIPTTIMQQDRPGRIARGLFSILKSVEDHVYDIWPFNRTGVSIMVIAKKKK